MSGLPYRVHNAVGTLVARTAGAEDAVAVAESIARGGGTIRVGHHTLPPLWTVGDDACGSWDQGGSVVRSRRYERGRRKELNR